jgi:uncharacterized protein with PIN domain
MLRLTASASLPFPGRVGAKLVLTAQTHFSKRYLKYLTKKFLKKNQLEVSSRCPTCGLETPVLTVSSSAYRTSSESSLPPRTPTP